MRKAINSNPLVQIGLIAVLAIGVAFLLMTRVLNRGDGGAEEPAATATPAAASPATGVPPAAGTTPAPTDGTATPEVVNPPTPPAADAPTTDFEPGPGLPGKVVSAWESGDTVALLITRQDGIDDAVMRRTAQRFDAQSGVAFFHTLARDIADYSRVTQGVEVDRVPALVILSPKSASEEVPYAAVSYGFRGPESVEQGIRDAGFKGKEVSYFPE